MIAVALLGVGKASAQTYDPAAVAQTLFDEAKHLMAQGRFGDACPKFLASFKLDPKPGAVVNLADCYESNGQTASAWARFREAASLAQRAGQAEREQYAREHVVALEPKLSRLTIAAPNAPAGLELLCDGIAIDAVVWGTAVPVDPGKHIVEARAPGKKPWSTTVQVGAGGVRVEVDVPVLEDASKASSGSSTPAGGLGTQRIAGIVLGSVSITALGVGSAFGLVATNKWNQAKPHCDAIMKDGTTKCDSTGIKLVADAKNNATPSTGLFVASGVLLVAGLVVFVTAPTRNAAPATGLWIGPSVVPAGAGIFMQGAF